jgi:A/G-specific adenine glycosylase
MLQQTQVATVIPYFERFLKRYPTLAKLAEADEKEILRLWEGLGYYRRARVLWRAAKLLHENNHATIPDDPDFVRSLPGFGRYTANAVLSQAYDRRLPILEANSQRVLCRLFGIERNPKESAVQKRLWQHAESLLPNKGVGDFNQAIMELGALVCTAARPNCGVCPFVGVCLAKAQRKQDQIPLRARPVDVTHVEEIAVVVRKRDRLLLVQRPDKGRWAGMWEVPHMELNWMEPHAEAVQRLLDALGLTGDITGDIAVIRHTVTRFRITMTCVQVACRQGSLRANSYPDSAWVHPDQLGDYPLAMPQRRLAQRLREIDLAS